MAAARRLLCVELDLEEQASKRAWSSTPTFDGPPAQAREPKRRRALARDDAPARPPPPPARLAPPPHDWWRSAPKAKAAGGGVVSVRVRLLSGQTVALDGLPPLAPVRELKRLLGERFGVPLRPLVLLCQGRPLRDDDRCAEFQGRLVVQLHIV